MHICCMQHAHLLPYFCLFNTGLIVNIQFSFWFLNIKSFVLSKTKKKVLKKETIFLFKAPIHTRIFMKNIHNSAYSTIILPLFFCVFCTRILKDIKKISWNHEKVRKNIVNKIKPVWFYSVLEEYSNKRTTCFCIVCFKVSCDIFSFLKRRFFLSKMRQKDVAKCWEWLKVLLYL